jgi:hypothetical protein
MPAKRKLPSVTKRKRPTIYPSLAKARASAQSLARRAAARGIKPITGEEFDRQMAEPSPWTDDEFEEFLVWLRQSRRTGRYVQ